MSGRSKNEAASSAGEKPEAANSRPRTSECPGVGWNDRWLVVGVCVFLAAIVWVVFGQTLHHEFINYDDEDYVYENDAVIHGLNRKGIEWAFTHSVSANWHPLTMMSHMLDCSLYGLNASGHHLTNVLLHTATVILLFLVLRRMTGFLWRSAFVAAVFAIHPLRVESVAWVAERKDVLSGLFFMLTLWTYTRYAQQARRTEAAVAAPGPSSATRHPSRFYILALLYFTLGLMSKPMLVTLPLVLLLLDYWPLGRFTINGSRNAPSLLHSTTPSLHLLLEKLPFLGLAVASGVVTIFAQHEAILPFGNFSMPLRVGNALISYVAYLGQMFWPSDLALLYPFPSGGIETSKVVLSLVLLAGVTTGVFVLRRRCPWLVTGWLWYLIMLVPVIGIIQVGAQARADRYTYLPQIGLYLMLTWAAAELCSVWRHRRVILGGLSAVMLAGLILRARAQTAYWQNSELLWTHTLACTSDNIVGHNSLGNALFKKGRLDEAIAEYQKALQLNPNYAEIHYDFGFALFQKGRVDEAIAQYQKALQINSNYGDAYYNLGFALFQKGRVDEAIAQYQKVLQIMPDNAKACNNLGNALLHKNRVDEAIAQFQKALQIDPANAEIRYNLGNVLFRKGRVDEAIAEYQKVLQFSPDNAKTHNNLGGALFQKGQVDEAIAHFKKALQINPESAEFHGNLGNALAQQGRAGEAIAQYQRALQLKPDSVDVLNHLAWLLATSPDARIRDGVQAVEYAGRACELTHYGVMPVVSTLAAAYAEAGRYDEAMTTAQKACALAAVAGETVRLKQNQALLELYRAHQPYHEAPAKVVPAAP